jgi:hypothetical protein
MAGTTEIPKDPLILGKYCLALFLSKPSSRADQLGAILKIKLGKQRLFRLIQFQQYYLIMGLT